MIAVSKETLLKMLLVAAIVFCSAATIAIGFLVYGGWQFYHYGASKRAKIDSILYNIGAVAYNAQGIAGTLKDEATESTERRKFFKSANALLGATTQAVHNTDEQLQQTLVAAAVATQNLNNFVVRTDASLNNPDGILVLTSQSIRNINTIADRYGLRGEEILGELLTSTKRGTAILENVNRLLNSNGEKIEGILNDAKLSSEALVQMSANGILASQQLPAVASETAGSVAEVRKFVAGMNRQQKATFIVGVILQAARAMLLGQ